MKLNVKLLSLAAAVVSLVASCVNEGLQEALDAEILDAVPTLEEQAAAVEASVNDLQNLQTSLKEYDVELDAEIVALLEQHVADFKKGGVSLEEGILAAFELQKKLGATIGSLVAEMDSDIYTIKLKKNFTELETGVKAWVGENFESLYPVAVAEAMVKASVAKFDSQLSKQKLYVDALVSDVEAGLRKDEKPEELKALALSVQETSCDSKKLGEELAALTAEVEKEYTTAVRTMLSEPAQFDGEALKMFNANAGIQLASVDNSLSSLITRVELCESQLSGILARLGALEGLVEDLEELLGMIQSVTLMTEYSADYAVAYYNMGSSTTSEGYKVRQPSGNIDLKYVVRPAAAASSLTASSLWNNGLKVIGYYAGRIQQAAVGNIVNFTIKNVTADDRGVVTVTVENKLSDDFYYKKTGAKMALSVTTGKNDLTSQFVEIVPKDASGTVYIERLTLSKDAVEFDEGEGLNLSAHFTPDNVTNKELVWSSANNNVVSVSGTGYLTGTGVGSTTVTVTTKGTDEWGRTLSATCNVKVNPAIRLSGPSYVEVGKSVEMSLDYPASMAIESKEWSTSDASKATVTSAGVVTGVGHTYNTATEDYGIITVYCKVNGTTTVSHDMKVVVTQPTSIKLNNYADNVSEITIKIDESIDLGATIVPQVPADQFRLFYQSTYGLGWIDSSTGKVNANKSVAGVAYVYIDVMNYDKSHYFAPGRSLRRTVVVRVNPYYVTSIKLNDVDLEPGQTVTLSPQFATDVAGKHPTNTAVTWKSSNTAVATVDQNGKVTSVTAGIATITATATDGSNVSGSCKVTVTERWKDFNVGDHVVRTSSGDIEFYSDLNTAKNNGSVVGIVITKTNPRVTDTALPASCTHGIAIALGEGEGTWASNDTQRVSDWATQNGTTFVNDVNKYSGYTNTEALKAFVAAKGCSSGIISAVNTYNNNNQSKLPNGTSSFYIPSASAMKDVVNLGGSSGTDFSNKLTGAGGTGFTNAISGTIVYYWTVSETTGTTPTQAVAVRGMVNQSTNKSKTASSKVRFVFAF